MWQGSLSVYKSPPHLFDDADQADTAANIHVMFPATEDERLGYDDMQVHEVGHYPGASRYLPIKDTYFITVNLQDTQ